MILSFQAMDGDGQALADTIEASDVREAGQMLRDRGLFVTEIAEEKTAKTARSAAVATTGVAHDVRMPVKMLALMTRQMTMLLNSGSAVVPAFAAIKRQMIKPKHAAMLGGIVTDLEEGTTLTDALRRFPRVFDAVYCAIIAAGEASGTLPAMFDRLATMVAQRKAMRNKVIGALTYPALLIVMSFHILLVLLLFVLPRFHQMFIQLAVDPPTSTKFLLATGAFVRGYWYVLLASAIAGGIGIGFTVTSPRGRRWISNIQLSIPFVGTLRSRLIQAQVFRTMGTLLSSRVGLLDALELVRGATQNRKFQQMFDDLDDVVTSGGQASTAFENSRIVEPYVCQAVRTGEESGNLGAALSYCADILDESNTELLNTTTRLIEPAILIVMGVLVGGVAASLFIPLFDMTSAMQ